MVFRSWYTCFMQPNNQPQDWQTPNEQPSQAPYVAPQYEAPVAAGPVVTLQPDPVMTAIAQPQPAQAMVEDDPTLAPNAQQPIRWQAAEYIQRDKSSAWFIFTRAPSWPAWVIC